MEPDVQKKMTVDPSVTVDIKSDSGSITTISTDSAGDEQWKEVGSKVSDFLADLPTYLSDFFGEYRRPIITIGLVIASLIALKLLFAVLGAINDLPLFSSLFELIGMGYSAWFIYRHLLTASARENLSSEFTSLKQQVVGK
jgi:CAAD domains of cyanobacterial aminoacyl-tRNA synthetase